MRRQTILIPKLFRCNPFILLYKMNVKTVSFFSVECGRMVSFFQLNVIDWNDLRLSLNISEETAFSLINLYIL